MNENEAKEFALRWLPAWTGNTPEKLTDFYSPDVFYRDPNNPDGIHGRNNLLVYFKTLLAKNPNWVWTQTEAIPMKNGFLNKWRADIPVGNEIVVCNGVCTVEFKDGLISRNETYFDTLPLFKASKK
jgi:hypothetical protein